MVSLNRWHYFVAFFTLNVVIIPFINFFSEDTFVHETSVWCFRGSRQSNLCKFKNICYDSQYKAFLFFLSEGSVIKGFDHYNKFQKIELSSIQNHNQFYANMSMIDIKNYKISKTSNIHSKVVLLSRFKPNNLMHSIHDDIFPLFLTLESVCLGDIQCMESYGLVFHDGYSKGPFFYIYKLFSKYYPIILNEIILDSELLCFKEMLTGLVQDGIVYQYGFKKPHGPIKPTQLTQSDVSRFTLYVKNKLQILNEANSTTEIILFSRKKNRKMLNTEEVKKMIKNTYQKLNKKINVKQININLFLNDFKVLLKIITQADGLIGMHGAEMILSIFLKPKSYVFEIFPFGINPETVSFIKPISELPNCNFMYFSWKNVFKNNSITHPDAPPFFGGISDLDEILQMRIKNAQEVPPVECCNNPLFLYHMYQDTIISSDFESFLYKSLTKNFSHTTEGGEIIKNWFYPYIVHNVSCWFHSHRNFLELSWNPPFNVKNNKDLIYSLFIKDLKGLFSKNFFIEKTTLGVETPTGVEPKFEVWISVYFSSNRFTSPDVHINCN